MGQTHNKPVSGNAPPENKGETLEAEEIKITDRRRINLEGEVTRDAESEDPILSSEETGLKEKLGEAEAKRQEAERKLADYSDRFRKAQIEMRAENDELRARLQRNFEQKLESERGKLVESLLESLDNLKRAMAAAEASQLGEADLRALLDGIRATTGIFESRMKALGLTPVDSLGVEFDPEIHEAVEIVPVAPEEDNLVVAELQPGYRFGERLLRPARVRVGRATESDE